MKGEFKHMEVNDIETNSLDINKLDAEYTLIDFDDFIRTLRHKYKYSKDLSIRFFIKENTIYYSIFNKIPEDNKKLILQDGKKQIEYTDRYEIGGRDGCVYSIKKFFNTIDEIREKYNKEDSKYFIDVDYEYEDGDYCEQRSVSNVYMCFRCKRLETDAEYIERLENEKSKKEEEIKTLQQLINKYKNTNELNNILESNNG